MNYLQWLSRKTQTKWWHDSAIPFEIDEAIKNGAMGVTTNPVLTYKSLQAVPDFWQPEVEKIAQDLPLDMRAEELLKIIAQHAAEKFKPIFTKTNKQQGYALGQLNPAICADSEKMLDQALRYVSWGENIAVKLPTVKAALPVIEELASRGIAVCTTLNFSVSQALAVGKAYMSGVEKAKKNNREVKPCFAVQQGGRLDEYRRRLTLRVSPDDGRTWPHSLLVHEEPAGYSDLAALPDAGVLCLYERGERNACESVACARIPLQSIIRGQTL